jgi:hypothetical protein
MSQPKPRVAGPPLPRWVVIVGSVVGSVLILAHFGCVVLNVMAAPSGPWLGMDGPVMGMPPHGVGLANDKAALPYLRAIKQTSTYHFRSNRVGMPEAYLKIRLLDGSGGEVKELRFPDPKAPAEIQRRQASLVRWLTQDEPVQPKMTEGVAAPGMSAPMISVWESPPGMDRKLVLTKILEQDIPRDGRRMDKPSPWSLVVVRALERHLCREYGADRAEVVRVHRNPITHHVLIERDAPVDTGDVQSEYGRLPK